MGLYDRDYGRDDEYGSYGGGYGRAPGIHLNGPLTLTTKLVLINVVVYLLQLSFAGFTEQFLLMSDWFQQPWQAYRLLTYGFLHDTESINHILMNMFVLWMFGRQLERKYGQREFLWFYLTAIVMAGLGWSICETLDGRAAASCVGASGGISAAFALFALNYPHAKVLFLFIIPMPMWIAALIIIMIDINTSMDRNGTIAATAHLSGALYGLYYYKFGWNPGRWLADLCSGVAPRNKPKLRVHTPNEDDDDTGTDDIVDEILKKIQAQGQDSLTRRERRILEKASEEYQRKRR